MVIILGQAKADRGDPGVLETVRQRLKSVPTNYNKPVTWASHVRQLRLRPKAL